MRWCRCWRRGNKTIEGGELGVDVEAGAHPLFVLVDLSHQLLEETKAPTGGSVGGIVARVEPEEAEA